MAALHFLATDWRGSPARSWPVPAPAVPTVPDVGDASTDPLDEFDSFARQLPARVGVAVVPVGGGQALTGGEYLSEVAWSTIKVPLAMAALAVDPAQIDNATAALTVSDNSAAQAMWDALGSDTAAAEAVQQVLASYGDVSTVVQQEVVRPGLVRSAKLCGLWWIRLGSPQRCPAVMTQLPCSR